MFLKIIYRIFSLILLMILMQQVSLSYEACDTLRACIGRSLKFTVNSGKGAHYIDVINNDLIKKVSQTMTFELWLKPQKQAGKIQYIGGLWGPNFEINDSWLVYIDKDDSLVFQLNGPDPNIGVEDFTVVKYYLGNLYDTWNHYAFVFNGKNNKAYIYFNGTPVDSAINNKYPLYNLKKINNDELSIQIGSTNALSNDPDIYRTFKGEMDEIRIWGRAIPDAELICNKDKALVGKEDSLLLYYRCNDPGYIFNLCDASGHKNLGLMRSGLKFGTSDRKDQVKVTISPTAIKDTVFCDNEKEYSFTLLDTSVCSTGIYIRTINGFPEKFKLLYNNKETILTNWNYIPLQAGVPVNFKIKAICDFIGTVTTLVQVRGVNSCGFNIANININITRLTELSLSKLKIDFDSLKARCIEKPFIDSTLRICNSTDKSNSPRNVTINAINLKMPAIFKLTYPTLPKVLKPGECLNVDVRFTSKDTTNQYYDTLKISSDDKCAPVSNIPISGKVKEVLVLYKRGTINRLDSVNFGKSCLNFPSDAIEYEWMNMDSKDISITNIIMPTNFIGKTFKFPIILNPITGYQANYFRFMPIQKGNFNDSIVFEAKSGGCTIRRPVYVKGIGYDAEISFISKNIDFGNIIVGQSLVINVPISNASNDPLQASVYLKKGDPFFITGSKSVYIPPKSTVNVPLTFRPSINGKFDDEICLYENSCFQSFCIPVTGTAYIERFSFEPGIMKIENVLACQQKDTTLIIRNLLPQQQTLTNFNLYQSAGKFTLIEPSVFPSSINLKTNEFTQFKFRYSPNDILTERADRALLEYETQDKEKWSAKLLGTSVLPKLYFTDEILYETIEVGGIKQDTVILQNISKFDITIDKVALDNGFVLVYPLNLNGRIIKPKDSIQILIDFVPTENKIYSGKIDIEIVAPCSGKISANLSGRGIIVPLDAPLKVISYGFVRPCNCEERKIPLINNSFYFDMKIDSILIDSMNVNNAYPQFFSWYSFYSPNGTYPFIIPKRGTDTLTIKYCPKNPFVQAMVDNNARLHIYASGSGWNNEYNTFLAGKQTLLFESDSNLVSFPPTRVDTISTPKYIHLYIPDYEFNPQQAQLEISSLDFYPDERVFYATDSLSNPFNLFIDSNNVLTLKLEFKPRAVRYYENKLKINLTSPCNHFDTSVTLMGSGFAPAFGLNFNFENHRLQKDTFRIVNCDTLKIPIYTSRLIPADIVDINCRIGYDTTKLEYLFAESYYLNNPCKNYFPNLTHKYSMAGGSEFLLKNACYVDSLKPLMIAYFIPKSADRDTFEISLDSIHFDTEEVILYNLIAEPDFATVIIQKPELMAVNNINFDSVKVLDCAQRDIQLVNVGDVPLNLFSFLKLPASVKLISSVPSPNDTLYVGDTISLTLEYCPRKTELLSEFVASLAEVPCMVMDSNFVEGIGYAPKFPVAFDVSQNFSIPDTLYTRLGDTLKVPVFIDRDFSALLNNKIYWIEKLNFNLDFGYDPFNLEYLSATSYTNGDFSVDNIPGKITMNFINTDSLSAGKIAELTFLSVVPDTQITPLTIRAYNFRTDSIMFLDIIPIDNSGTLVSQGKCGISTLNYTGLLPSLLQNTPNPWKNQTTINFIISEKSIINLELYSLEGILLKKILYNVEYNPGTYSIILNAQGLSNGVYFYILRTNTFVQSKSMLLIE